ncbi:hypothetical protein KDA00_00455 [Candidatus Saccharibacteria bacterium]|nr:hypothetical protein [Candidatus Saccharibacteria bacterium]
MQPDQNQPQMPNINPVQPVGSEPPQQPTTDPGQPTVAPPNPIQPESQSQTMPEQPIQAPTTTDPMQSSTVMPQADQQSAPTQEMQQPIQPTGIVQPPSQSTNPMQPGYVPPANSPGMANMSSTNLPKENFLKSSKLRILIVLVVILVSVTGIGILVKDTLFSGSKITVSDLVEETSDGVKFKHPKQWSKIEDKDFDIAYTEGGKKIDDSDQGMGIISESIGVDFESLTDSQKTQLDEALKKQFADPQAFSGDGCEEITKSEINKTEHDNYPLAYRIEVDCGKYTNRNVKGKMVAILGVKGRNMDILAVVAIDKTWDKSGDAFNDILDTFDHE